MSGRVRGVVLGLVAVLLVGGLLLDARGDDGGAETPEFGDAATVPLPALAAADAVTSSWYCPGVPAPADGSESGTVTVVNTGATTVEATLTALPSDPAVEAAQAPLSLAPGASVRVRLAELTPAPYAGAVVEVFGTGVAVEQTTIRVNGSDTTPCTGEASGRWYLASGSTTLDDQLVYTLLNPFPDDAVVDVVLSTEQGSDRIDAFVVPGRSLRVIQVDEVVRRRAQVAGALVARTGRIVVGRIQKLNPDPPVPDSPEAPDGRGGVSSPLGAPALDTAFAFASVEKGDGVTTRLVVANPGEREAVVLVELWPEAGVDPTVGGPEPLELTVPPRASVALSLAEEELVPPGRYSASVRSSNGVPFAVERVVDLAPPGGLPAHSVTPGVPRLDTRWVLPAGMVTAAVGEQVLVANPSTEDVEVAVRALTPGGEDDIGFEAVPVAALGVAVVDLAPLGPRDALAVTVTAPVPVVAERVLTGPAVHSRATGIAVAPVRP